MRSVALIAGFGLLAGAACSLTVSLDELSAGEGEGGAGTTSAATTVASTTVTGAGGDGGLGGGGEGPGGAGGGLVHDPPWWDPAWPTRRRIAIANSANAELPAGFQIGTPIDVAALQGAAPFAALRVVRWDASSSGWVEVPRVIDDLASGQWLWLPLWETAAPAAVDDDYWLYAGNPDPPPAPNDPAELFDDLWDGFDAGLDPALWETSGAVSVSGGELVISGEASGIRSVVPPFPPGFAVDFVLRIQDESDYFWGGFQRAADFIETDPWILWASRDTSDIGPEATLIPVGVSYVVGPQLAKDAEPHLYGVERFPDHVIYRYDGAEHHQIGWAGSFAQDLQVKLYAGTGSALPLDLRWDFVRVRRVSDPAPGVTLGPPETYR